MSQQQIITVLNRIEEISNTQARLQLQIDQLRDELKKIIYVPQRNPPPREPFSFGDFRSSSFSFAPPPFGRDFRRENGGFSFGRGRDFGFSLQNNDRERE